MINLEEFECSLNNNNDKNTFEVSSETSFLFDDDLQKRINQFKQKTVLSGNEFTQEELIAFIKKHYGKEGMQRYKVAQLVMEKHKLNSSKDMLLALACNKKSKIILATAGAGKTTMLQLDLEVSKIIDLVSGTNRLKSDVIQEVNIKLPRILYFNYNKHNTKPIIDKHTAMVHHINQYITPKIDDDIESITVHAFCKRWLTVYKDLLKLEKIEVLKEEDKSKVWDSIIVPRWKKYYGDGEPIKATLLNDLYLYKESAMLEWDSFFETSKFIDSELKPEFAKACIEKYIAIKKAMRLMDFVDFIKEMIFLLNNNEEVRNTICNRYSLIIADEAQDFTALMNALLLAMQNPNTKIIAVGDTDQTIYSFQGASPDTILSLSELLEDCEVLGLDTNYRCPKNIIKAAKSILDHNVLRFDKNIVGIKENGKINLKSYSDDIEKISILKRILSNMSEQELNNTVIGYRNNDSSIIVAEELFYADIPFRVTEGQRPFMNDIFRKLLNILQALDLKEDTTYLKFLWQVLPISKTLWLQILDDNAKKRISHIEDLQFDAYQLPASFYSVFQSLLGVASKMESAPLCYYIDTIVKYFHLYYFDFVYSDKSNFAQKTGKEEFYLERAVKFFNRDILFKNALMDVSRARTSISTGVTLSTIHALKGLEFNNVIAIDMNESIFPNYTKIEQMYPIHTALEEKESENRLCYVLLTRAKETLTILYQQSDPSVFLQMMRDTISTNTKDATSNETPVLTLNGAGNSLQSKMAFINRMLS